MEETYKPERRFEVSIVAFMFLGYWNVKIALFKADPENNTDTIDFTKAIKDYDEDTFHAEDYLKSLFTWEEVEAMREYFKNDKHMHTFNCSEICFPIPKNIIGVGSIPVGIEAEGFYEFTNEENYPLKFKVRGYYDLRRHKRIEQENKKKETWMFTNKSVEAEVDESLNAIVSWIKNKYERREFEGIGKLIFLQQWLKNVERKVTSDSISSRMTNLSNWIRELDATRGFRDVVKIQIIQNELKILKQEAWFIQNSNDKTDDMMD